MGTSISTVTATLFPKDAKEPSIIKHILKILDCEIDFQEHDNGTVEFTVETHHLPAIQQLFPYVRIHLTYHSSRDPK